MKFLRLHSIAAGLVLLGAAFGFLATGAGASDKHAIEVTVRLIGGKAAANAVIYIHAMKNNMIIEKNWANQGGTHDFMVPDIEGRYCIYAFFRDNKSNEECYENEYPATVELTIR